MKKILVPTDFSKSANKALDYAIAIAKKENAQLFLLHAYSIGFVTPEVPYEYVAEQIKTEEQNSTNKLRALADKVNKKNKLKCSCICEQGSAVDIIINAIENKKIDLIIMGTKGASGMKELFIGSTTEKLIESTTCPVIAIPERSAHNKIKTIAYATDYRLNDLDALKSIVKIAKIFNAKIKVIHISDGEYFASGEKELLNNFKERISKQISYKKIEYHLSFGKSLEKALDHFVKNKYVDLIAVSTHQRNLFDRLFGKSIIKKMVYHTKIPLLAFHYKKDPIIFT